MHAERPVLLETVATVEAAAGTERAPGVMQHPRGLMLCRRWVKEPAAAATAAATGAAGVAEWERREEAAA